MDSAYRLKAKDFYIYFIANLLLSLLMNAMDRDQMIVMMIMNVLFYFMYFPLIECQMNVASKRKYMRSYCQNIEN